MTNQVEQKLRAVQSALSYLPPSGTIGLGSGSTAELFIEQLGRLVQQGKRYVGVPTSKRSRMLAEAHGIPLLDEAGPWAIDMTVDGADEVSDVLDLIKGGGACHLREKIVNASSHINLIVVDESKLSTRLGEKWAVPIEVAQFGHQATARHLERFGSVELRRKLGEPVITDSGSFIYDVRTGVISDPGALDTQLLQVPGVVETGLFVRRASLVVVAGAAGTQELRPPRSNLGGAG